MTAVRVCKTIDVEVDYRFVESEARDLHVFRFWGRKVPHRKIKLADLTEIRRRIRSGLQKAGVETPLRGAVLVKVQVTARPDFRLDLDNVLKGVFRVLDGSIASTEDKILEDDGQVEGAFIVRAPEGTTSWIE